MLIDTDTLSLAFADDADLEQRGLWRTEAGVLWLTSGRVVTLDPLAHPDQEPLTGEPIPAGNYPVEAIGDSVPGLLVAWWRPRTDLDAAAVRWVPALREGESADELPDDEYYGFPVDAGIGAIMDADAAAAITERENQQRAADPDYSDYYSDIVADEIEDADPEVADHHPLGPGSAHNVILARSGWGDGVYPSYWAIVGGERVALAVDFRTLAEDDDADANDDADGNDDANGDDDVFAGFYADLPPEEIAAMERLGTAVVDGDLTTIHTMIAENPARWTQWIPSRPGSPINAAILANRPEALEALLAGRPAPAQPQRPNVSYLDAAQHAAEVGVSIDPRIFELLGGAGSSSGQR